MVIQFAIFWQYINRPSEYVSLRKIDDRQQVFVFSSYCWSINRSCPRYFSKSGDKSIREADC